MPSEMQERIARAIYEADWGPAICVPWGKRSTPHQGHYRNIAIAVMKAMLEPTPPMSLAADDAVVEQYAEHPEWDEAKDMAEGLIPTRIWAAMLSHEIAAAEEARRDQD